MGVKGLWKLVESTGVPVPLETLEQKILAVDVSIWLHQAIRGYRGLVSGGQANAPLLTLFHRICKLLFYRIRPVFIFDGGVPYLKKQTLASRRLRREVAANRSKQVRERLLNNLLRSQAVRSALGRAGPGPSLARVPKPVKEEKDMYELPPLPQPLNAKSDPDASATSGATLLSQSSVKSDDDSEDEVESHMKDLNLPNLHQFEFESDTFQNLPIDARHEILTELQGTRKENSWATMNEMPQELENFSEFQMGRLRKRRKFQETLDTTRDEIRKKVTQEMEEEMFGDLEKYVSLSQRVVSEDATHSILIKKKKVDKPAQEDEDGTDTRSDDGGVKRKFDDGDVLEGKGKSPSKKRKSGADKDFLTELAKQGILGIRERSDSDSESEWEDYHSEDEVSENRIHQQRKNAVEEAGFLRVVGSLLENSGLTQDEILALIKQEDKQSPQKKGNKGPGSKKIEENGPSTSSQATGFVFNPDADYSSDDYNLVEVPEMDIPSTHPPSVSSNQPSSSHPSSSSSQPSSSTHSSPFSSSLPSSFHSTSLTHPSTFLPAAVKPHDSQAITEQESNNIGQLLGTKNNSLWMKIVQQKVDDMVHVNALKTSPTKASLDTRKNNKKVEYAKIAGERKSLSVSAKDRDEKRMKEMEKLAEKTADPDSLKPVKISLDFDVKPLKMEDDIFADIFTDIISIPSSKPVLPSPQTLSKSPAKCDKLQDSTRTIDTIKLPQSIRHKSIEGLNGKSAEKNRQEQEVENEDEIMSSSDDSDLEEVANDDPEVQHTITSEKPVDMLEDKIIKSPESPTTATGNNETPNKSMENAVYELVKLEVEKMLKSRAGTLVNSGEAKTEVTKSDDTISEAKTNEDNINNGEINEDEIMSSSDESKSSESNNIKEIKKPEQVPKGKEQISEDPKGPSKVTVTNVSASDNDADDTLMEEQMMIVAEKEEHHAKESNVGKERSQDEISKKGQKLNNKLDNDIMNNEQDVDKKNEQEKDVGEEHDKDKKNEKETIPTKRDQKQEEAEVRALTKEDQKSKDPKLCSTESNGNQSDDKIQSDRETNNEAITTRPSNEQPPPVPQIERPLKYSEDELIHLERELVAEQNTLVAQAEKSDRIAKNLNDQTYGESQHLLQLFGIPYLVAPMEAEAQCGFFDAINLTAGTITDDSDIFLFGGTKVYKNFFNQMRHVELFKLDNIQANIGLDREKMISLAMLTGSDYTEGVESVGGVAAMEVLAEFPGEGIDCLKNMKKWWHAAHRNVAPAYGSKVRQKLCQVSIPESFPNERVFEAYLTPEVDESKEKFTWSVPNVEALRTFTGDKFGWSIAKADEILVPVMKRIGIKTSQLRIDSFFNNIKLVKEDKIASKRVQDAIAKVKGDFTGSSGGGELAALRQKMAKRERPQGSKNNKKKTQEEEEEEAEVDDVEAVMMEEGNKTGTTPTKPKGSSRTLLIDPSETKQGRMEYTESTQQGKKTKPSQEGNSKPAKRGRKKKTDNADEGKGNPSKQIQKNTTDDNAGTQEDTIAGGPSKKPPKGRGKKAADDPQPTTSEGRKLTKEIMFKALLEKEKINQREEEQRIMKERKRAVAEMLKQKKQGGKR